MTSILFGFAFAFLTAIWVILGDFLIKLAADGEHPVWSALVFAGCAIYAASAVFWFYAMRHVTLGQAGVAYSMITLVALCAIGVVWFGERMAARELAGLGCALMAMVLMARTG